MPMLGKFWARVLRKDAIPNTYIPRQTPQPGTQSYAFVPGFGLPPQEYTGRGFGPVSNPMRALQPPQVYKPLDLTLTGIAGIVTGGIVGLPLGKNPNSANQS